jgi:hypothetical protein
MNAHVRLVTIEGTNYASDREVYVARVAAESDRDARRVALKLARFDEVHSVLVERVA